MSRDRNQWLQYEFAAHNCKVIDQVGRAILLQQHSIHHRSFGVKVSAITAAFRIYVTFFREVTYQIGNKMRAME